MNLIIQTPTPNLPSSLEFYRKLNYTSLAEAPAIVTDGKVLIEINPDRFARAGVKLYQESWMEVATELGQSQPVHSTKDGFLLSDPSGAWIYLIEGASPIDSIPDGIAAPVLGNYAGISLETIDIMSSFNTWEKLGFKKDMGSPEQGWLSCKNEAGDSISFMKPNSCPHLFFNPSLTYFNSGKNLEVIAAIRNAGIPITEEITAFNSQGIVDNVIIRDPGGYGFFIFND